MGVACPFSRSSSSPNRALKAGPAAGRLLMKGHPTPSPQALHSDAIASVSSMKQGLLSVWRTLTWPWRRFPKTVGGVTGRVAVLCLVVVASNAYILLTTDGEAPGDVADVPPAE